ncbi:hypothetical protein B0T16DRAFT_333340 [Cercophora newfieldiana]|uniref:Uncharacterized protein n=1 Tax=Cercophora newfieldiana TaxID=92897 RepID=A0AA40CN60_9PEZI|nr:hypothetical protein B0T16DRAFT_333340 [Cercophora newfieldiana]
MCDFEEFVFTCGHSTFRLKSYCHFARNDPNHQCFGVKKLKNVWDQTFACDGCVQRARHEDEMRRRHYGKDSS